MERLLNKLERKIGKYAIEGLSLYLIVAYGIGYVLQFSGSLDFLRLNPYEIFNGQLWRLVTWVLVPPDDFSVFTCLMLFLYYSFGTALENAWGAFRYNVYLFSGMFFTLLGAIALYLIGVHFNGFQAADFGEAISWLVSTYYINMSIYLAMAATYPDVQVLLYFIIPVKVKWMGILYGAYILWEFLTYNFIIKVVIAMSLLNFLIFYLSTRSQGLRYRNAKWTKGFAYKNSHNSSKNSGANNSFNQKRGTITKHKCAVCGQTEQDNSELEFRFCSKCNGNYEYCNVHLFTHKHI